MNWRAVSRILLLLVAGKLVMWHAGVGAASPERGLHPTPLGAAIEETPKDTRALVILDARLYKRIATDIVDYARAASARRKFVIGVLPIRGLDDRQPEELRCAIREWRSARPGLEGILFVGNVKLPSFFMPRPDTPSTRLWPRYYEDLTMVARRRILPGTVLREGQPGRPWPFVAGIKEFKVPAHDFDDLVQGSSHGSELWTAYLPVGFTEERKNTYEAWAEQLTPFFRKALAFCAGKTSYGRGLYLVSNDLSLLARSRPVWMAVGPKEIEYYAINEKGPGAFKKNPAGYVRVDLTKYPSADDFLAYASKLPWMDEGWQSPDVFLGHMRQSRRRFVWWNVHSNPEFSLVTARQAYEMENGGLIALLNGCAVAGFQQPRSSSYVDAPTMPDKNVLVSVVYGKSAFLAALGCPHNRVNDERGTPLFQEMYSGGYLGRAHLLRRRQQDRDSPDSGTLRTFQEMLIGDPFLDTQ
jgi:hypothetical protein